MDRDIGDALARGDALRASGQIPAALAAYADAGLDRTDTGPLAAGLAWRVGLAYQQLGEPRLALDTYRRASTVHADEVDRAWLTTGAATAHWALGDAEDALRLARDAVDQAITTGDDQVLTAAYIALALSVSLGGDPATVEEAYARAAGHAAAAGDLVQLARIDINRSHHLLADARFTEAVESAARGGAAAADLGSAPLLAIALGNEADGLIRLARYDDALDRCERALALSGEIGTHRTAGALVSLAQVHLRRGAGEQARAALEQALRLTSDAPDRQVRVPALACLAVALLAEDDTLAVTLAGEALASAQGSALMPALLAAGRVASASGDTDAARCLAGRSVEHARQRRERAWLAEALELRATTLEPPQARAALREAHQIWADAAAAHDADRVLLQLAQLPSPSRTDRLAGRLALARLTAAGVRRSTLLVELPAPDRVRIATFGRFEVFVDGAVIPAEAWQSRRARELLRLLICRRGRAIPRLEICEVLWPDDDPDRTTHRLSVLLSIVRGVIGPEVIVADQSCVALNAAGVRVDVEQFLADVTDAVALLERGAMTDARGLLAEAVRNYTDDPFADAPYDEETGALREEAQAARLQALRLLADCCRRDGDLDQAATYLPAPAARPGPLRRRRPSAPGCGAEPRGPARPGPAGGGALPGGDGRPRSAGGRLNPRSPPLRPVRGRAQARPRADRRTASGRGVDDDQVGHDDRPRLVVRHEDPQLVAARLQNSVVEDLVELAADGGVDRLVHDLGVVDLDDHLDPRVVPRVDPVGEVGAGVHAGARREPRGVELVVDVTVAVALRQRGRAALDAAVAAGHDGYSLGCGPDALRR